MPKWIFVNIVVLLSLFAGDLVVHTSPDRQSTLWKPTGLSPVFPLRRSTEN